MEKSKVEPTITWSQIEKLIDDLKNGVVKVGEQSIMYSNYMDTVKDFPKLRTLPVKVPGIKAEYDFSEYTSFCRTMQQPDHGHIIVTIVPNDTTIEMKSLRDYLIGYRELDIFQEETCANVLIDVVRTCKPKYCQVHGIFTPRGATKTESFVTYYEGE